MARRGENIRKRKDGRYEARYKSGFNKDGAPVYKSVYGKTYSEAKNSRLNFLSGNKEVKGKNSLTKSFDVDTSKEDPSNDDIRFEYDNKGRISKCYYEVNDIEVSQAYIYTDDTVQIYGFNGSIVIDDITFDNVSYDDNTGFNEYDGYYLKIIFVNIIDNFF